MLSLRLSRLHTLRGLLFSNHKSTGNKCIVNPSVSLHLKSALRNPNLSSEVSKTELLKAKTSPEKDRLLFFYDNPKYFMYLNGFALVQFVFWLQMSEFSYKKLKDINLEGKLSSGRRFWWEKLNFKDEKTRTIITCLCFFLGYVGLTMCWMYTLRSVKMLVLRKGGNDVSIVTYAPLGKTRTIDVPLEKLTTRQTRQTAKDQLPIKVQGKWFYYLLDTKRGVFPNPELFDYTAGMKRTFTK